MCVETAPHQHKQKCLQILPQHPVQRKGPKYAEIRIIWHWPKTAQSVHNCDVFSGFSAILTLYMKKYLSEKTHNTTLSVYEGCLWQGPAQRWLNGGGCGGKSKECKNRSEKPRNGVIATLFVAVKWDKIAWKCPTSCVSGLTVMVEPTTLEHLTHVMVSWAVRLIHQNLINF